MNLKDFARGSSAPAFPAVSILTTGEGYDIRHPDLIMVGRRSVIIGIPCDAVPTV